ncbi:MAG: hypothetical protein J0G99_02285 [Alphaproteobacteria bacterium]|nr:hypothetical protein [Alphaproteobacteria bacterium]
MPKLPDMSAAAVRRREALTQAQAQSSTKAAKAEKSSAKNASAPKRRTKRG